MLPASKQIAMFDQAGNSKAAWVSSADYLLAAARLLRAGRNAAHAAPIMPGDPIRDGEKALQSELMLKGFALECLLKAVWVKRGNRLAAKGKYLGIPGTGEHDLLQLSKKLALRFDAREKDVLKRLSIFTTSLGRYPIPKHWSKTQIQKLLGGGKGMSTFWCSPRDDISYGSVRSCLDNELSE